MLGDIPQLCRQSSLQLHRGNKVIHEISFYNEEMSGPKKKGFSSKVKVYITDVSHLVLAGLISVLYSFWHDNSR